MLSKAEALAVVDMVISREVRWVGTDVLVQSVDWIVLLMGWQFSLSGMKLCWIVVGIEESVLYLSQSKWEISV